MNTTKNRMGTQLMWNITIASIKLNVRNQNVELVFTTCFWNNFNQIRSKSKD